MEYIFTLINPLNTLPLNGLILAGGKSSRMGFDKALLNFHGTPQVLWLHELMKTFCDKAFISRSRDKIPGGFEFIEDYYDWGGPMNGILSAFKSHPEKAWLVVPVDMPNVESNVIAFLLKHRDPSKMATCFMNLEKLPEPFPLILEPEAYPYLLDQFNNGMESMFRFLKNPNANRVAVPDANWLRNVNEPSQL